ncbi:unnamed protein product, partial [marine sediment metagenome]
PKLAQKIGPAKGKSGIGFTWGALKLGYAPGVGSYATGGSYVQAYVEYYILKNAPIKNPPAKRLTLRKPSGYSEWLARMQEQGKIKEDINEDFRITTGSKKVLKAFLDKKAADSKKLDTDGTRLDGNWMGGKDIAHWVKGKIEAGAHRPHGRADQTILRWIKKNAAKNDLKGVVFEHLNIDGPGNFTKGLASVLGEAIPPSTEFALVGPDKKVIEKGSAKAMRKELKKKGGLKAGFSVYRSPGSKVGDMVEDTDALGEAGSPVAKTILRQLGGGKFVAMTGAKNLVSDKNKLMFSIGRNKTSANKVSITLTSMDLYDVEFGRVRAAKYKMLKTYKGVYADKLRDIFTEFTGMYTSLSSSEGVDEAKPTGKGQQGLMSALQAAASGEHELSDLAKHTALTG